MNVIEGFVKHLNCAVQKYLMHDVSLVSLTSYPFCCNIMNSIRQIRELNERELRNNVSSEASWHTDYRDTAFIYIGGLPFELSEGDIVTIFSQYGEPTYINLVRDMETGKSKGFAFLKYEDQRSTDLAVDNLGGSIILGRTLKVDHTRYKKKDNEADHGHDLTEEYKHLKSGNGRDTEIASDGKNDEARLMIKEEFELAKLIKEHDDEDPMKEYLIKEKVEEVAMALATVKTSKKSDRAHKSHRHHHHHRSATKKEERRESKRPRS